MDFSRMIKQHSKYDCFVCSLAMALNLTYEEISERLGKELIDRINEKQGCYDVDIRDIFEVLGLVEGQDVRKLYIMIHLVMINFLKKLLWGRRALLTVKSKNIPDGLHMIYWDGSEVFDPSCAETYDDMEEVEPIEVWLFNENEGRIP